MKMEKEKEWTREEVIAFITDEKNEYHCEDCPYNMEYDSYQYRKPCGQWVCWVTAHVREL